MFDHRLHDILKENVPISRPLTSTWPHLRCDVWRKGNIEKEFLYFTVLRTMILVHIAQRYEQLLHVGRLC